MAEAFTQDLSWPEAEDAASGEQTEYHTFPRRITPALVGAGGAFTFIGALGAWLRSLEVTSTGGSPRLVGVAWGYSDSTGKAIAILAAVAVFIAAVSYFTDYLPRYAPAAAALVLVAVLIARLITLNSRAEAAAALAKTNPSFQAFNARFGWGAWMMVLGLVLSFLGLLVGVLREIDLRRGKPE